MFTWPENIIPLPSTDFSVDPSFNNLSTRMDSGRARVRPRTTKPLVMSSVTFELNRIQYAFFVAIWRNKLNNGTNWFTMRLPQPNNQSLTNTQVRFVGDYKSSHKAHENWDISATIEQYQESVMSLDELDAALKYGLDYEAALESDLQGIENIFPKDWEQ